MTNAKVIFNLFYYMENQIFSSCFKRNSLSEGNGKQISITALKKTSDVQFHYLNHTLSVVRSNFNYVCYHVVKLKK